MSTPAGSCSDTLPQSDATMHFCMDTVGTYDGMFNGEHVLVSAGLAYRNPGSGFTIHIPDEPASIMVDSGGFQAATRWNGAIASSKGFAGPHPYTPTELHEWADSIGADCVAGMDVAAGRFEDIYDYEQGHVPPKSHRQRMLRSFELQKRQHRQFQTNEYNHALMPVIQGQSPDEYEEFIGLLQSAGLDQYDRIAIGNAKRATRDDILHIASVVRDYYPDKHIHLFGGTLSIWKDDRFDGLYDSMDTSVWNYGASSKAEKKECYEHYAERLAEEAADNHPKRLTNE